MPISIECPSCLTRLSVEESILGQSMQCPKCGNAFTPVAADAIGPVRASLGLPAENQNLGSGRGGDWGSWRTTKIGLILILTCPIVVLMTWGLMVL